MKGNNKMANGKVLATVNGAPITEEDVDLFIKSLGQRGQAYENPQGKAVVLEELIAQKLFLAEAKKNLFEYEEAFKAEMNRVKERLLINYGMEKTLGKIAVSDEDVKKYYDENADKFQSGETVNASHILVAEEEMANDLLAKINAGEITFEDAAKNFSTCPSGKEGGNLGDFGKGQMVPEFDEACFTMEVGETRGPVKTQFGYHLIRLNGKSASTPIPFAEIKEQIRSQLMGEKQQAAYRSKVNQLTLLFPVDRF